jgi:hypothetical protein
MTTELVMAVSAAISAFAVIAAAIIAIYRTAKKIGDSLGTDSQGRTISDRLERVEHQLWENGGSSLADRVNNIEKHVVKVSTEIEFIKDITMGIHTAQTSNTNVFYQRVEEPIIEPVKKPLRKKRSSI